MRGFSNSASGFKTLKPNNTTVEGAGFDIAPTATGFKVSPSIGVNETLIYIAIRRPMKPPTSGTQVFYPQTGNAIGVANLTGVGFAPDTVLSRSRQGAVNYFAFTDKLRGAGSISTVDTSSEVSGLTGITGWLNDGVGLGGDGSQFYINSSTYNPWSRLFFRRAPGFFDQVCYTGTGAVQTVNHNLGVAPELIISKNRGAVSDWWCLYNFTATDAQRSRLNLTEAALTNSYSSTSVVGSQRPDASGIYLTTNSTFNTSGANYVNYLFATCPGISKVGSFVGNGSSQTIDCGFTAGARFILIKATSTTGSWWVWDSARGIVAASDPALQLNSTAAEVTSADAIDPASVGFIVNQEATCSINASGVSYLFFSVA